MTKVSREGAATISSGKPVQSLTESLLLATVVLSGAVRYEQKTSAEMDLVRETFKESGS